MEEFGAGEEAFTNRKRRREFFDSRRQGLVQLEVADLVEPKVEGKRLRQAVRILHDDTYGCRARSN